MPPLLDEYARKLGESLSHLEYSFEKVKKINLTKESLNEENLETLESFCARFSKSVDLYLTKYLKAKIKMEDPGFDGSLRDYTNLGEKLNLVESADEWMKARELRNSAAHDYTEEELVEFFKRIMEMTPMVLKIKDQLQK